MPKEQCTEVDWERSCPRAHLVLEKVLPFIMVSLGSEPYSFEVAEEVINSLFGKLLLHSITYERICALTTTIF